MDSPQPGHRHQKCIKVIHNGRKETVAEHPPRQMCHRFQLVINVELWCHLDEVKDGDEANNCLQNESVGHNVLGVVELVDEVAGEHGHQEIIESIYGFLVMLLNLSVLPVESIQTHEWEFR